MKILPKKAQKRIEIARDVIAQLDAGEFKPTPGVYCRTADDGKCQACAKGALLLSYYKLNPDQTLNPISSNTYRSEEISKKLTKYFSKDQLDLMEAAFEKSERYYYGSQKLAERAELFGKGVIRSFSPKSRLRAIMKNVIKNDGCFIP